MKKNVIILTSGLSGSSVLTGLIARGGYWTGDATFRKPDYDTFENRELIELNKGLFREVDYTGNYAFDFSPVALQRIAELFPRIDSGPYRSFLQRCEDHRPWIWKDPRLWLTIRFWKNLLDFDSTAFILLTRDPTQAWISSLLRRQITTYRYARTYEENIHRSLLDFLRDNGLSHLHVEYEDLIENPEAVIGRLNAHLSSTLGVEDLKAIYKAPLFRRPKYSWRSQCKAGLIYLKNYSERLDIVGRSSR